MYCVAQIDGAAIRKVKDSIDRSRPQVSDCEMSAISNDAGIAVFHLKVADVNPSPGKRDSNRLCRVDYGPRCGTLNIYCSCLYWPLPESASTRSRNSCIYRHIFAWLPLPSPTSLMLYVPEEGTASIATYEIIRIRFDSSQDAIVSVASDKRRPRLVAERW